MDGMMMMMMNKKKKGLMSKTWERCKSIGRGGHKNSNSSSSSSIIPRSKSCPGLQMVEKEKRAAKGCFSVYVGPQMQRFVIKTEYANHPLFKMLLEEAVSEYGYNSQGPLALPCEVHIFYKVLMEMNATTELLTDHQQPACTAFRNRSRSYHHLLSPSPMLPINHF